MALDLALRNDELLGLDVFDRHGAKIGPIAHVYAEEESGRPLFASVKTGLLRLGRSILALKKAEQTRKGIRVPYDRPYVERAPRFDARRDGTLTRAEQVHLNHYYGIVRGDPGLGPGHSTYAGEEHLRGGVSKSFSRTIKSAHVGSGGRPRSFTNSSSRKAILVLIRRFSDLSAI